MIVLIFLDRISQNNKIRRLKIVKHIIQFSIFAFNYIKISAFLKRFGFKGARNTIC